MGNVLRVLVVLMFLLGLGALFLSIQNYGKRELLVGRTHQLEEGYIRLAKTIEAKDMPDVPPPELPLRDISPVTSREMENPEVSDFWDGYRFQLEPPATAIPMLDLGTDENRFQLRQLYQIGSDGKVVPDSLTGRPSQKGPGTMADLMDSTLKRAMAQSALLGTTRAELKKVREELVVVIEEFNSLKKAGRKDKKTIEDLNATISRLEDDKRQLAAKVSNLESQIDDLNEEVAEARLEVEKQLETISDFERQVKKLNEDIAKLTQRNLSVPTGVGIAAPAVTALEGQLTPGPCGTVVEANNDYRFAILRLDDRFLDELIGPQRDQPMPQAELLIHREGFNPDVGDMVAKVRLRQIVREKNLVVAEILVDWMQTSVMVGDTVIF
ncbi:MAG: hypothetical protein ACOX5G_05705 [Kiritimatiellia bacterium]|jgi:archaellum component FlaC